MIDTERKGSLEKYVWGIRVTHTATTAMMISEHPGDDRVSDESRSYFHKSRATDLHVRTVVDRHRGVHLPVKGLTWEVVWDHQSTEPRPAYPIMFRGRKVEENGGRLVDGLIDSYPDVAEDLLQDLVQ